MALRSRASLLQEVHANTANRRTSYGVYGSSTGPQLIVLGNEQVGKTRLISSLRQSGEVPSGVGLEFHSMTLQNEENETLELKIWCLEGGPDQSNLLKFALDESNIWHTMLVICVSLENPWTLLSELQCWLTLMQQHVVRLKLAPGELTALRESIEVRYKSYSDATLDGGAGANETVDKPAPIHRASVYSSERRMSSFNPIRDESNPWPYTPLHPMEPRLGDNEVGDHNESMNNPLGIPVTIVITKTDMIPTLEKQFGYTDEHFDVIQYRLRELGLRYRAGLIYLSTKEDINIELFGRYLKHQLYGTEFNLSAALVEPAAIFIPSGWDNVHRLELLRKNLPDTMVCEKLSSVLPRPTKIRGKSSGKGKKVGAEGAVLEETGILQTAEDEQVFLSRMQFQLAQLSTPSSAGHTPSEETGLAAAEVSKLPTSSANLSEKEAVLSSFFNSLLARKNLTEPTIAGNQPKSTSHSLTAEPQKNPRRTSPQDRGTPRTEVPVKVVPESEKTKKTLGNLPDTSSSSITKVAAQTLDVTPSSNEAKKETGEREQHLGISATKPLAVVHSEGDGTQDTRNQRVAIGETEPRSSVTEDRHDAKRLDGEAQIQPEADEEHKGSGRTEAVEHVSEQTPSVQNGIVPEDAHTDTKLTPSRQWASKDESPTWMTGKEGATGEPFYPAEDISQRLELPNSASVVGEQMASVPANLGEEVDENKLVDTESVTTGFISDIELSSAAILRRGSRVHEEHDYQQDPQVGAGKPEADESTKKSAIMEDDRGVTEMQRDELNFSKEVGQIDAREVCMTKESEDEASLLPELTVDATIPCGNQTEGMIESMAATVVMEPGSATVNVQQEHSEPDDQQMHEEIGLQINGEHGSEVPKEEKQESEERQTASGNVSDSAISDVVPNTGGVKGHTTEGFADTEVYIDSPDVIQSSYGVQPDQDAEPKEESGGSEVHAEITPTKSLFVTHPKDEQTQSPQAHRTGTEKEGEPLSFDKEDRPGRRPDRETTRIGEDEPLESETDEEHKGDRPPKETDAGGLADEELLSTQRETAGKEEQIESQSTFPTEQRAEDSADESTWMADQDDATGEHSQPPANDMPQGPVALDSPSVIMNEVAASVQGSGGEKFSEYKIVDREAAASESSHNNESTSETVLGIDSVTHNEPDCQQDPRKDEEATEGSVIREDDGRQPGSTDDIEVSKPVANAMQFDEPGTSGEGEQVSAGEEGIKKDSVDKSPMLSEQTDGNEVQTTEDLTIRHVSGTEGKAEILAALIARDLPDRSTEVQEQKRGLEESVTGNAVEERSHSSSTALDKPKEECYEAGSSDKEACVDLNPQWKVTAPGETSDTFVDNANEGTTTSPPERNEEGGSLRARSLEKEEDKEMPDGRNNDGLTDKLDRLSHAAQNQPKSECEKEVHNLKPDTTATLVGDKTRNLGEVEVSNEYEQTICSNKLQDQEGTPEYRGKIVRESVDNTGEVAHCTDMKEDAKSEQQKPSSAVRADVSEAESVNPPGAMGAGEATQDETTKTEDHCES